MRTKEHSLTSIYIWGMVVMFCLVLLFVVLLIYEEYNDFDREEVMLRKNYIAQKQDMIDADTRNMISFLTQQNNKKGIDAKKELAYMLPDLFVHNGHHDNLFIYDTNTQNWIATPKSLNKLPIVRWSAMRDEMITLESTLLNTAYFEPWGWMIGFEVDLSAIETEIASQKKALKKRLIKMMMEILSLGVILFGFALILAWVIHAIITRQTSILRVFFQKASKGYIIIDSNDIELVEFKTMVPYINSMVEEIHARKKRLKDLNLSLEEKIAEKTEDLSRQNLLLGREKSFNESLVKAQDSFIKHSIHEINTPLAVILTNLDIFKIHNGVNPYLAKIEAATKMIATIYDDLSYMVKKNRIEYPKEWIDLSAFCLERLEFFDEIAKGNMVHLVSDITPDIVYYFSPIELQRLIDNNLSNAIKYAKRATDIVVQLEQNESFIILRFVTQSKQIKNTEEIFMPFHREDNENFGFGLGLEIVQMICKKEAIAIDVTSTQEQTIFVYTLPQGRR